MLLFSVCSYTRRSWNRRRRPWDGGTWCFCPLYLIQSLFIPTHSILIPFHPTLSHQIQSIPQWSLGENMMRDQHFHMLETQLTHSFLAREKHQVSFLHSDHILTQLAPCLEQTLRFQDELVPVTGFHLDPAGAVPWTFAVHSFDCREFCSHWACFLTAGDGKSQALTSAFRLCQEHACMVMSQPQRLGLFCALVVLYHLALKVCSSKSCDLEQFVLLPPLLALNRLWSAT